MNYNGLPEVENRFSLANVSSFFIGARTNVNLKKIILNSNILNNLTYICHPSIFDIKEEQ